LKLIDRCVLSEPLQGNSQEFLLCLGRGGGIDQQWYRTTIAAIAEKYASEGRHVTVETWWGEEDSMIPTKGQKWLDELFASHEGKGFHSRSIYMPKTGHDGGLEYVEMVCAIFEDIRDHSG